MFCVGFVMLDFCVMSQCLCVVGRFFAAASHTLVTNVCSKRLIDWDPEASDTLCSDVGDRVITRQQSEFAGKQIDSKKVIHHTCMTFFSIVSHDCN